MAVINFKQIYHVAAISKPPTISEPINKIIQWWSITKNFICEIKSVEICFTMNIKAFKSINETHYYL